MSITFRATNFKTPELVDFLASEYVKDTGIPVHLFSVVNAHVRSFDRSLAITDGQQGTLFIESDDAFKAYGSGDPFPMVRVLARCNAVLEVQ